MHNRQQVYKAHGRNKIMSTVLHNQGTLGPPETVSGVMMEFGMVLKSLLAYTLFSGFLLVLILLN